MQHPLSAAADRKGATQVRLGPLTAVLSLQFTIKRLFEMLYTDVKSNTDSWEG